MFARVARPGQLPRRVLERPFRRLVFAAPDARVPLLVGDAPSFRFERQQFVALGVTHWAHALVGNDVPLGTCRTPFATVVPIARWTVFVAMTTLAARPGRPIVTLVPVRLTTAGRRTSVVAKFAGTRFFVAAAGARLLVTVPAHGPLVVAKTIGTRRARFAKRTLVVRTSTARRGTFVVPMASALDGLVITVPPTGNGFVVAPVPCSRSQRFVAARAPQRSLVAVVTVSATRTRFVVANGASA